MQVTLLDEEGLVLTEITSHLGRSPGQMLVDWATRPDVLFQYYFDRGQRAVTAIVGAAKWSAVLGTRWQMGARFWFLHQFLPLRTPARAAKHANSTRNSVPGVSDTRAVEATSHSGASAAVPNYEPRGVLA